MRTYITRQYERVSTNTKVCMGCKVVSWIWATYITIDVIRDWF